MGKKEEMKNVFQSLARGHAWGQGRATQTHGDKRAKRLKTRGARLRAAVAGEG